MIKQNSLINREEEETEMKYTLISQMFTSEPNYLNRIESNEKKMQVVFEIPILI